MGLRIQNNVEAFNTHRQLSVTSTAASKSMEKLSSGYRINRAADDAAGLAISEKMRGQIGGLAQLGSQYGAYYEAEFSATTGSMFHIEDVEVLALYPIIRLTRTLWGYFPELE